MPPKKIRLTFPKYKAKRKQEKRKQHLKEEREASTGSKISISTEGKENSVIEYSRLTHATNSSTFIVPIPQLELQRMVAVALETHDTAISQHIYPGMFLDRVQGYLQQAISDKWKVSIKDNMLNIVTLTNAHNPHVQKCITYSSEKLIQIHVHHRPLLINHFLWNFASVPDEDAGIVAHKLWKLAVNTEACSICNGSIDARFAKNTHKKNFEKEVLVEEGFSSHKIYRSIQCSLLTYKKVCEACRFEQNNMIQRSNSGISSVRLHH